MLIPDRLALGSKPFVDGLDFGGLVARPANDRVAQFGKFNRLG